MTVRLKTKTQTTRTVKLHTIMAGQIFRFASSHAKSVYLKTLQGYVRLTCPAYDNQFPAFAHRDTTEDEAAFECRLEHDLVVTIENT